MRPCIMYALRGYMRVYVCAKSKRQKEAGLSIQWGRLGLNITRDSPLQWSTKRSG